MSKSHVTLFVISLALVSFAAANSGQAQTTEDGSHVWPYVVYTTVGSPSTAQLTGRDSTGQAITGSIQFFGYDAAHITVNGDGTVTGIVKDTLDYSGSLVWAIVDGDTLQHPANVKVLSQDYGFEFTEVTGEHTILYYPPDVLGDDLQALVELYDYLDLLDRGHEVMQFLLNVDPNSGQNQVVTVEPEENYDSRHCRNLYGTLRLTYEIGGSDFQNCFMIPYLPGRSPRLDVVYHQFGDSFQPKLPVFMRAMSNEFKYVEGWANLMFTAVPQMFNEDPTSYPLTPNARSASQAAYTFQVDQQSGRFDDWIAGGAILAELNSNIIHGIILRHRGDRPIEFYQRYFYLFQNALENDLTDILEMVETMGSAGTHTFFAAHLSAVVRADLYDTFVNDYHYPIDQTLFDTAFDRFTQLLDDSIFTGVDDSGIVLDESAPFEIYPLPASESVTFSGKLGVSGPAQINVYDLLGRQVVSDQTANQMATAAGSDLRFSIDLSELSSGTYFYRIVRDGRAASGSLVVGR